MLGKIKLILGILILIPGLSWAQNAVYNFHFHQGGNGPAVKNAETVKIIEKPEVKTQLLLNIDRDVRVQLDGKNIENPHKGLIDVDPGEYQLTLLKPGFEQKSQMISIQKGEVTIINALSGI